MVRLIDCEVYAVESIDITRLGLLSFFCNNHTDELVVVYSQGRGYQLFLFIKLCK